MKLTQWLNAVTKAVDLRSRQPNRRRQDNSASMLTLELLESRVLLTCIHSDIQERNGTLFIIGTPADDTYFISDNARGDIVVDCSAEPTEPHRFEGIKKVVARTEAGADTLNYVVAFPAQESDDVSDELFGAADLDFRTGGGDDTLTISGPPDRQLYLTRDHDEIGWKVNLHTGGHNDSIWIDLGFPVEKNIEIDARLGSGDDSIQTTGAWGRLAHVVDFKGDMDFDAGPGDDTVTVLTTPTIRVGDTDTGSFTGEPGRIDIDVMGRTGADDIRVELTGLPATDVNDATPLRLGSTNVKVDGGDGNNEVFVEFENVEFRRDHSVNLTGGRDYDRLQAELIGVHSFDNFEHILDGGSGEANDQVLIYDGLDADGNAHMGGGFWNVASGAAETPAPTKTTTPVPSTIIVLHRDVYLNIPVTADIAGSPGNDLFIQTFLGGSVNADHIVNTSTGRGDDDVFHFEEGVEATADNALSFVTGAGDDNVVIAEAFQTLDELTRDGGSEVLLVASKVKEAFERLDLDTSLMDGPPNPGVALTPSTAGSAHRKTVSVDLGHDDDSAFFGSRKSESSGMELQIDAQRGNDQIVVDANVPPASHDGWWFLDFNGNPPSDDTTASLTADLGNSDGGNKLFVGSLAWATDDSSLDTIQLRLRGAPAELETGGIFEIIVTVTDGIDYELDLDGSIRSGTTTILTDRHGVDINHVGETSDLHATATGVETFDVSIESNDLAVEVQGTVPANTLMVGEFRIHQRRASDAIGDEPGLPGVTIYADLNSIGRVGEDVGQAFVNLQDILGAGPERGRISLAAQSTSASLSLENLELLGPSDVNVSGFSNIRRQIKGVKVGGSYAETIIPQGNILIISEDGINGGTDDGTNNGENFVFLSLGHATDGQFSEIASSGKFVSRVTGGPERNRVVNSLANVLNHGELQQSINTGGGEDTVIHSIDDFQNYGTAMFDTGLGARADRYTITSRDIFVAAGASLDVRTNGGRGRDMCVGCNIDVTVGGVLTVTVDGGAGADAINMTHRIRTLSSSSDDRPAINIWLGGGNGNDRLESWLYAPGVDDELIYALIDGGRGRDLCGGNIDAVNCEL